MTNKNLYTIRYVSQRTGLTPHVIRAWEKRYDAVVPKRSPKNRRLYSEEDVQRLLLLKSMTDAGHNISQVAQLDSTAISDLAHREEPEISRTRGNHHKRKHEDAERNFYNESLSAVLSLDQDRLEHTYGQATIALTRSARSIL